MIVVFDEFGIVSERINGWLRAYFAHILSFGSFLSSLVIKFLAAYDMLILSILGTKLTISSYKFF